MPSTGSTKVAAALGTFALLLFLFTQPMAATPSQPRIRVLILDGFSNHDWQQTTALLRGILEASGLFTVSVATAPSTTASPGWEQWRPNFSDYDVVIQTCNDIGGGPSWPREVQIAFENYVRNGGGVLVFHSGNNAFPDWPVYNQMIGLGWRNKQQGDAITINSRERLLRIPSGQAKTPGTMAAPTWLSTAWATIPFITACPSPGKPLPWKFTITRAARRSACVCSPTDMTNTPE